MSRITAYCWTNQLTLRERWKQPLVWYVVVVLLAASYNKWLYPKGQKQLLLQQYEGTVQKKQTMVLYDRRTDDVGGM